VGELEGVGPVRVCLTERLGPVGTYRYSVLFTSIAGGFRLRMYRCDLMGRVRRSLIWLGNMDECLPAYIRRVKLVSRLGEGRQVMREDSRFPNVWGRKAMRTA